MIPLTMAFLFLCFEALQNSKPQEYIPTTDWELWETCGKGSSVTTSTEFDGGKMETMTVLVDRGENTGLLRITKTFKGTALPVEERIIKAPPKFDTVGVLSQCPKCNKPFNDHKKTEIIDVREKLAVAGKELDCLKRTVTAYDCDGKIKSASSTWYSKDIPGWLVKGEGNYREFGDKPVRILCTAFEKK